jgi:glycosyltransferase GT-like protein
MILTREQIVDRLLQPEPVSIVRLGDGESILLNAMHSIGAFRTASEAVLRRQMGVDPTVKQVEEIRANLIETYTHCDILGVPMHKHLSKLSSHWTKVAEVLKENVPKHTDKFCDIDVAYQMLDDGSYDRLLLNRPILNYISCRDLDRGFKHQWKVERVNKFTIAPEAKFTSGYNGDSHYPTQFNKIPRWLDVIADRHPGTLLLVGAGVIGKIYCNWWRDRGGVAMDVGAVMDIFYGKVTRGPDRGMDKDDPDPKYKL